MQETKVAAPNMYEATFLPLGTTFVIVLQPRGRVSKESIAVKTTTTNAHS